MFDLANLTNSTYSNAENQYLKIAKWFKTSNNQFIGYITKLLFEDYITIRTKDGHWITFKVHNHRVEDFRDDEMVNVTFPNDFEIGNLSATNYNDGKFVIKNFKKRRYI